MAVTDSFTTAMEAVIVAQNQVECQADKDVLDASIIKANMEARHVLRCMSTDETRHLCLLDMICFWGLQDPPCYTGGHSKRLLRECYAINTIERRENYGGFRCTIVQYVVGM